MWMNARITSTTTVLKDAIIPEGVTTVTVTMAIHWEVMDTTAQVWACSTQLNVDTCKVQMYN